MQTKKYWDFAFQISFWFTSTRNSSTSLENSDISYDKIFNHYVDEETIIPDELPPEDHWVHYRSDEEL